MKFHVIDKRTGKKPIFDHNHVFKEKWFKESGLIWCDIDGWYISEDGTLVLVDDCGKVAYPPIDRFDIVYDEPTVCDIEQIRAEILNFKEKCNASDYLGCGILEVIDNHMAESSDIDCDGCICNTGDGGCQKEDIEETTPMPKMPCEEKVSIDVHKQVMWERDIAISQLNELGYGLGQKMWISVNDFLPEERENPITMDYYQYPVTFQNGDVTDIRYYKFGDGHWWHGSQMMDEYVTAWMPIPKPYVSMGNRNI